MPRDTILGGARYLRWLTRPVGLDLPLVLGADNAGPHVPVHSWTAETRTVVRPVLVLDCTLKAEWQGIVTALTPRGVTLSEVHAVPPQYHQPGRSRPSEARSARLRPSGCLECPEDPVTVYTRTTRPAPGGGRAGRR